MNFIFKREKKQNFKRAYSQCGEDILIEYVFQLRNIQEPTYIDIGAHHPYYLSNTALFYEKGGRGVNIEANPLLLPAFKKERPEDINLNIGIGKEDAELDFYIMQDNSLSTFSIEEYTKMQELGKTLERVEKIAIKTLPNIIQTCCNNQFPDFMSIDVEGMDFEILQTIDFENNYPKVICVEAAEYSPIGAGKRRNDLIDFLVEKGYYEYANTNLNAIMVKNEFWFI